MKDKKDIDVSANIAGALLILMGAFILGIIWGVVVYKFIGNQPALQISGGFIIGIVASHVYENVKDK